MSSTAVYTSSSVGVVSSGDVPHKKSKRDKSEHKKKKRAREEDEPPVEETPRKTKKSKSEKRDKGDSQLDRERQTEIEQDDSPSAGRSKKSKKDKSHRGDVEVEEDSSSRKKSKKNKERQAEEDAMDIDNADQSLVDDSTTKRKNKEKKSKKHRSEEPIVIDDESSVDNGEKSKSNKDRKGRPASRDALEDQDNIALDALQAGAGEVSTETQDDVEFPIFTQTVSLYVPFLPAGFDKPLTNIALQHLDPLINHFSPTLHGVLLGYSNLNLSDRPVKPSLTNPPTDKTPALLRTVDEYAANFAWLTFDAQLFIPARGKWMEGVIQLQNEGHIGVVCWNKFNVSIESKRLPKGWKWVELAKKSDRANGSDSLPSPDLEADGNGDEEDILDGEELQVVEQMHTTGYWVNEEGKKVRGKLRFRIKSFDVGLAGDYGYLSIEGTFLDDEAERLLVQRERAAEERRRRNKDWNGLPRHMSRRVPEFSMTKLGKEEPEEDSGQRTVLYKGSRPGTPDD
ncbi:hypothetical protein QBC47DRAFT_451280 [Echria macrotheca]|uniref:DNA-directed RNA polymerase subunit n=1 Tax=Echria macrotheca TaxID=438768 RepID=A0AAJ0FD05_9PEZI|nr:hypothetical protein QBC47DRAFT_451280 [Echria macrotheca]